MFFKQLNIFQAFEAFVRLHIFQVKMREKKNIFKQTRLREIREKMRTNSRNKNEKMWIFYSTYQHSFSCTYNAYDMCYVLLKKNTHKKKYIGDNKIKIMEVSAFLVASGFQTQRSVLDFA